MSASGIDVLDADGGESACRSSVLVPGIGVLGVDARGSFCLLLVVFALSVDGWVGFRGRPGGCGCASAQRSSVTLERCTANGDGCPSL